MIMFPLQSELIAQTQFKQEIYLIDVELPAALNDDIFDDLPFEQQRQALREEIERDPQKGPRKHSPQKYNFLIR